MNKTTLGIIAIALAAILSVGLAGYTTLTLTATETQEQYLTDRQNYYTTQTDSVRPFSTKYPSSILDTVKASSNFRSALR